MALLAAAAFVGDCRAGAPARPLQAPVCPAGDGNAVTQIDLFDGDPADGALLAPDDTDGPDSYRFTAIHAAGRAVTVRCHYADGSRRDIRLRRDQDRCRSVAGPDGGYPELRCDVARGRP